jgi:5-(hydroxymethyl)furfural/furfural oxidase
MFMVAIARSAWHPLGRRLGTLFSWINKPFSTGSVRLASNDPSEYPDIAFQLLSDSRDLSRLKNGFRLMAAMFATESLGQVAADPFAATHGALASLVREPTAFNRFLTFGPALLTEGPAVLRRGVVRSLLSPGFDLEATLKDEEALEEAVRKHTIGGWHPSGTCKLGAKDDPDAVVDPRTARVHGVGGLSVVDASIMPTIPRANTNIPTIMIAEKMAEAILGRSR